MAKKQNRLNLKDKYKVIEWLKGKLPKLDEKKSTIEDAAKWASVELDMEINEASLKYIIQSTDIKWTRPTPKSTPFGVIAVKVEQLIKEQETMNKRLKLLETNIATKPQLKQYFGQSSESLI